MVGKFYSSHYVSSFLTYCIISALAQLQIGYSFPLFLLYPVERNKLSCITGCITLGTPRIQFPWVFSKLVGWTPKQWLARMLLERVLNCRQWINRSREGSLFIIVIPFPNEIWSVSIQVWCSWTLFITGGETFPWGSPAGHWISSITSVLRVFHIAGSQSSQLLLRLWCEFRLFSQLSTLCPWGWNLKPLNSNDFYSFWSNQFDSLLFDNLIPQSTAQSQLRGRWMRYCRPGCILCIGLPHSWDRVIFLWGS